MNGCCVQVLVPMEPVTPPILPDPGPNYVRDKDGRARPFPTPWRPNDWSPDE